METVAITFLSVIIVVAIIGNIHSIITFTIDFLKDIIWRSNNKNKKVDKMYDMGAALDRWQQAELDFQRHEVNSANKKTNLKSYMDAKITLQDVQDYVKRYPPVGQMQCTGCHTVCKDDCDHTCGGKCSTVCNNSCRYACVGICGGSCSTSCGDCTGNAAINKIVY